MVGNTPQMIIARRAILSPQMCRGEILSASALTRAGSLLRTDRLSWRHDQAGLLALMLLFLGDDRTELCAHESEEKWSMRQVGAITEPRCGSGRPCSLIAASSPHEVVSSIFQMAA